MHKSVGIGVKMTEFVEALTGLVNATKNAGIYSIVALLILLAGLAILIVRA
jgi:hypothetical protein